MSKNSSKPISEADESVFEAHGSVKSSQPGFQISQSFWTRLVEDPDIKRHIDLLVDQKFKKELAARLTVEAEETLKKAYAEGFQRGFQEGEEKGFVQGQSMWSEVRTRYEGLCEKIVSDKQRLLRSHEPVWAEALAHLLRRFMVLGGPNTSNMIREWLSDTIETYGKTSQVEVFLNPKDAQLLLRAESQSAPGSFKITEDPTVAEGNIRCQLDAGGFVFSREDELKKLEDRVRAHGAKDA